MMSVRLDVDQNQCCADTSRIKTPAKRYFVEGEITLNKLEMDLPDCANRARADHGPRLAHHRIVGMAVCQAEFSVRRPDLARARSTASSAEVGSSRISSEEPKNMARAIASDWRSPPEMFMPRSSNRRSQRTPSWLKADRVISSARLKSNQRTSWW